jgi:hypothetical protein
LLPFTLRSPSHFLAYHFFQIYRAQSFHGISYLMYHPCTVLAFYLKLPFFVLNYKERSDYLASALR